MTASESLYLSPEDLYRIGNSSSPLLTKVRESEIDLTDMNGIRVVVANGRGVSLYNEQGLAEAPLTGWVWKIRARSPLPPGLKLVKTATPPGHYHLCPSFNMTLHEYIGLLESVVIHCEKLYRKQA
jgi:hypothetical protein